MTKVRITVTVHDEGIKRYGRLLASGKTPAVKNTLEKWGQIQKRFLHSRFVKYSNGGGNWPPLAASTIAKKKRNKWQLRILRVTDTLLKRVGSYIKIEATKGKVTVGYRSNIKHPMSKKTTKTLAGYHQGGTSKIPPREITVPPDATTRKKMTKAAKEEYTREAKKVFPPKRK